MPDLNKLFGIFYNLEIFYAWESCPFIISVIGEYDLGWTQSDERAISHLL